MGAINYFGLLLWKNWLLQKRKKVLTFFEIALPIFFAVILLLTRMAVSTETFTEPTTWQSFEALEDIKNTAIDENGDADYGVLFYTPRHDVIERIMNRVANNSGVRVRGFENEDYMVEELTKDGSLEGSAGVVFQIGDAPTNQLPDGQIKYKLRMPSLSNTPWFTSRQYPNRFATMSPRARSIQKGADPSYARRGFTLFQHHVDREIIRELRDDAPLDSVNVRMQLFPYPPYIDDPFIGTIQTMLPFLIMFSFIVTTPNICKDIVLEKERRLKEFMKLMGLSNWLHWSAWFFKYFVFMLIAAVIMTILFIVEVSNGAVFNFSDAFIIFIIIFLYAISTVMFCFLVSTLFDKANAGAAAGGILFFLTYIPYFFITNSYEDMSFGQKIASCFLHNLAMAIAFQQVGAYESTGAGAQWENFHKAVDVDDDFTLLHCIIMLIVDIILYGFITWYTDAVKPGRYGVAKPFYFPFTKWYWCGTNHKPVDHMTMNGTNDDEFFEKDTENIKAGIQIRNLRKVFKKMGKTKVAVNRTNLDVHEGQITALLGHNGAGKTTTMNMLTGFMSPTDGTAYINGYDIRTDLDRVRKTLGLCPQHNILFDTMTVQEHLMFYGRLKGLTESSANEQIGDLLKMVDLEDKRYKASSKLSGGMKRKLHVAISLIGDSKIIILDEPTSGMDPEARRQIWNLLQRERTSRTMILSTHFMDEADLLGDRIAIMAEGVVRCAGSSLFLKNKFGVGYHLIMVKDNTCNVDTVTGLVTKYVPDAKLESNISAELSFNLPRESSTKFEDLFTFLEMNRSMLGIKSFGASVTTMEEVFMKVGESVDESLEEKLKKGIPTTENGISNAVDTNGKEDLRPIIDSGKIEEQKTTVFGGRKTRNTGVTLSLQQFLAMFVKRVIHSWRNRVLTISQILVPIVFTILACLPVNNLSNRTDQPELILNLKPFDELKIPSVVNTAVASNMTQGISNSYKEYLSSMGYPGFTSQSDMQDYVLGVAEDSVDQYNRQLLVGGSFTGTNATHTTVTAHFNGQPYHPAGITLAMMDNALMRYFLESPDHEIVTSNHPLPLENEDQLDEDILTNFFISFSVSLTMMFGMAFLVASFVVFLIKERTTAAKHLQFVSGVHAVNYWFSTFVWDFINFMIPGLIIVGIFAAFDISGFIDDCNWGYTILVLVLYAWSSLPFTYLLSNMFSTPASGYVWVVVLTLLLGIGTTLAVMILSLPGLVPETIPEVLRWVFYALLPHFCFGYSLLDMMNNAQTKTSCEDFIARTGHSLNHTCAIAEAIGQENQCCEDNAFTEDILDWSSPGLGRPVFFMCLQGLLFFALIMFGETGKIQESWQSFMERAEGSTIDIDDEEAIVWQRGILTRQTSLVEDEDVALERHRINNTNMKELLQTDSLILKELRKFYGGFLAVDRISLGVKQGECFGLLGINGAGKTTTFKMLTGDVQMTSGEAYLDGHSVKTNIRNVQQRCGYCPQFDALIDQMTVTETLWMYARLRGVQESDIKEVTDKLIKSLLLEDHSGKQTMDLSGGNKRKLSTAISLIGDPPVVFLDEPTTGMDPVARRLLWDTLTRVRTSGRTLVLTSHSMEECEALCTRLVIMVNGQFRCIGATQHLKSKFGEGYSLICKVQGANAIEIQQRLQALMNYISATFPQSEVKDIHQGQVQYQVNAPNLSWAKVFGTMESIKEQFSIEDYSVSQTTLEQVFLNFARAQRPPRDLRKGAAKRCCDCCKFICGCSGNCCRPSRPVAAPQPPTMDVMVVQPTPQSGGTTTGSCPINPATPGEGGYTNVGYVGQQNREPEVTYQPESENINFRL